MKEFGLMIKLGVAIVSISLFGALVPEGIQQAFFTISMVMKGMLIFLMPLIVFAFIVSCLAAFQQKAPLLIVLILGFVTLSNFFFIQLGYLGGMIGLPLLGYTTTTCVQQVCHVLPLAPLFQISFPQLMSTDMALLLGTLVGLYGAFSGNTKLTYYGNVLKKGVQWGLVKIFIPLVPLYVIGFLFKIHHDESLGDMLAKYGPVILLVVTLQAVATILFYVTANGGKIQAIKSTLRNVLPSGLVALSTMSSAATLPLTLIAAEKNTKNKAVAEVVIPATTNIHHVGDSLGVPILLLAVYLINGMDPMGYGAYLIFSAYYVIAKFGVASVPGGEVIILIPILEKAFGFTDSMSGLITTLYILCDPFITATNVLCNGGLAIMMDKLCGRMRAFRDVEKVSS